MPLMVASWDNIDIQGTLDVSSTRLQPGAGANPATCGSSTGGAGLVAGDASGGGGGGGALRGDGGEGATVPGGGGGDGGQRRQDWDAHQYSWRLRWREWWRQ